MFGIKPKVIGISGKDDDDDNGDDDDDDDRIYCTRD